MFNDPIVFIVLFVFVVFFIFMFINFLKNFNAEIVTVNARLIDKSTEYQRRDGNSSTYYYLIFENTETKERLEMSVKRKEYNLYTVGDVGKLSYQREWFKGFVIS